MCLTYLGRKAQRNRGGLYNPFTVAENLLFEIWECTAVGKMKDRQYSGAVMPRGAVARVMPAFPFTLLMVLMVFTAA